MSAHFCITIQLLHRVFHGRISDEEPEWPPSPLRIFQALVAGSSLALPDWPEERIRAFKYLESFDWPPVLIVPETNVGDGYRLSLPNNSLEKVAAAWARGNYFGSGDANPAGHRTMKRVRPVHLSDEEPIYCAWPLPSDSQPDHDALENLKKAARCVTSLGWGIDMAIGDARPMTEEELANLPGQRWLPTRLDAATGLRIPTKGTLRQLQQRNEQFLRRIGHDGLRPPEPLSVFRVVEYRRASDPATRPTVCFALVWPEGGYRAFDPVRNTARVAGLVRHATKRAAVSAGWPDPASFVLGHGETEGEKHQSVGNRRFAYLPLPSIQPRGASRSAAIGSVRRVCVTVLEPGHEAKIDWASRMLAGQALIREETGEIAALLSPLPQQDKVLGRYLGSACEWASVSPVVLPGYDDPAHYRRRLAKGEVSAQEQRRLLETLHHRTEKLLRKAIRDAGFPDELATHADLDWRDAGFWPGTERAGSYTVPDHLTRFPRLHVRLRWRDAAGQPVKVAGPISLGGGRFCGLGLFAASEDA
jgi:CRISPR-associated protein Csb2